MTPTITCSLRFDRLLEPVRALGDLLLRIAALDRLAPCRPCDRSVEVCQRLVLDLACELLDEVRAAERIDDIGDPGLVRDDLLRPQRQRRGLGSVGNASASSSEFVCSDCVPPSTAAIACSAVRTTLLYGCWAVSDTPAVCA